MKIGDSAPSAGLSLSFFHSRTLPRSELPKNYCGRFFFLELRNTMQLSHWAGTCRCCSAPAVSQWSGLGGALGVPLCSPLIPPCFQSVNHSGKFFSLPVFLPPSPQRVISQLPKPASEWLKAICQPSRGATSKQIGLLLTDIVTMANHLIKTIVFSLAVPGSDNWTNHSAANHFFMPV